MVSAVDTTDAESWLASGIHDVSMSERERIFSIGTLAAEIGIGKGGGAGSPKWRGRNWVGVERVIRVAVWSDTRKSMCSTLRGGKSVKNGVLVRK